MSAADHKTNLWYAKKRECCPEIPINSHFWAHLYLHEPKYIISFFDSGLNANSNLFQFSLHTDKSFSAVKDFSNWSYLRSVIELEKKNVSSALITSTNTLFCCHICQFFIAYVFVLPNIKKKRKEEHVPCSDTLTYKPLFVFFLQLRSHFRKIDGEWIPQSSNHYKYFTCVYRKK